MLTVDKMDDAEEMRATDTALDTLGFNQDEKDGLYKVREMIMMMKASSNMLWQSLGEVRKQNRFSAILLLQLPRGIFG